MQPTGLTDLDELALTCRTERARDYIQDALLSYRAGAYRAAIVATWIAVTFDLIDKLRELSTGGDAQAKEVITNFDKTLERIAMGDKSSLPAALLFERNILETARSRFQLLDDHQHVDMQRLLEDRHRCAHPTFDTSGATYQPSAELARTHIRNAIAHVLQQPPVQGKAAIQSVVDQVHSRYFPTSPHLAKQALGKQLDRARPALVTGLVDRLIWDMFDGANLYAPLTSVAALRALLEQHRSVAEPRVRSQAAKAMTVVRDDKLLIACALVANLPEAWEGLDAAQRERFHTFLAAGDILMIAHLIKDSADNPILRDSALKRIANADTAALAQLVSIGVRRDAVDRAVDLFSTCRSYNAANHASAALIVPLIEHITPEHVKTIVKSPTDRGSDLRYAGGMVGFVAAAKRRAILPDQEFDDLLKANRFEYLFEAGGPFADGATGLPTP